VNDLIKKLREGFLDFLFPQKSPTNLPTEIILRELKKPDDLGGNIVALFDYGEKLSKKLIWEMKYKNNGKAAKILAEVMYAQIINCLNDWVMFENFHNPILIPVPLSKEKLEKRGYNQTEILVQEIMAIDKEDNLKYEFGAVEKVRETRDQSSLKTKTDRLKNLKDCFKITALEKVKGRNIIIIDDVYTTGATIKEIKKILKKAGAKKIKAFVAAH